jgi:hypothetical protein
MLSQSGERTFVASIQLPGSIEDGGWKIVDGKKMMEDGG